MLAHSDRLVLPRITAPALRSRVTSGASRPGALPASAAELELQGPRLVVTGLLDGSQARAFVEHLESGKVRTVRDLVSYFPRAYEDRRVVYTISDAPLDTPVCVRAMAASAPMWWP